MDTRFILMGKLQIKTLQCFRSLSMYFTFHLLKLSLYFSNLLYLNSFLTSCSFIPFFCLLASLHFLNLFFPSLLSFSMFHITQLHSFELIINILGGFGLHSVKRFSHRLTSVCVFKAKACEDDPHLATTAGLDCEAGVVCVLSPGTVHF